MNRADPPPNRVLAHARSDYIRDRAQHRGEIIRKWFDQSDLSHVPKFAPDVVARICEMMLNENVPVTRICRDKLVPDAPSLATLKFWARVDPRIGDALGAAREAQAEARWDALEDELREMFHDEDGNPIDPQRAKAISQYARLISENRRFEVAKLVKRTYGDDQPVPRSQFERALAQGKVQVVQVIDMPAEKAEESRHVPEVRQDDEQGSDLVGYADTGAVPSGE